ncbi:MAG: penicillin-binding protein 2 [Propioniciclava sp.]|uniref:peptidoglycan D,D-transpeptidase FtsI family protein n=1 Tax=Propioniciclava sp. TaxID=2038686 RepID=UPI0039E4080B
MSGGVRGGKHRVPLASSAFRLRVLALAVAVMFSVLAARAIQIQVVSADEMAAKAATAMTVARDVPAQRGTITGRDGQVLAFTEATVNVIADPSMIATNGKEPEAVRDSDRQKAASAPAEMAKIIAKHTGVNAGEIENKLRKATTVNSGGAETAVRYQLLAKQVPSTAWLELTADLSAGKFVGVFRESNPRRVYPMNTVASNVVGAMSAGKGLLGLEYSRESDLAGVPGRETYETSPNGKIPLGNQTLTPAVNGRDIQLTLDADLQWMTERRLAERVQEAGGTWGVALVMDVETGELLTMANYPSFDSNDLKGTKEEDLGNRAITAAYEPGSVQKVLTLSALLDAGLTTPDTAYPIDDTLKIGDHTIQDAWKHGKVNITTRGILVKSSNVGAITAARAMEPAALRDYMLRFGLGTKTNLGLPGEAAGSVPPAGMPRYQADSMAYGYGLSTTAVQMAAAVAAVANGGVYTEPTLVKATGVNGSWTPAPAPASHRVISDEAARQTIEMMEQRTMDSADQLKIAGYRTGTKTGTARIAGGSGYQGQVASIIGVAPVEDPQVLVYVLVGRPDTMGAGLGTAGPVYRDIMALALPRYGVQPRNDIVDTPLPLVKE